MIIFFNGFNSSSTRIVDILRERFSDKEIIQFESKFHSPDILQLYREYYNYVKDNLDKKPLLIGSSLGSLFAEKLSEDFGLKMILLNPSIYPLKTLVSYQNSVMKHYTSGEEIHYHDFCDQLESFRSREHLGSGTVFIGSDDEYIQIEDTYNELKNHYRCVIVPDVVHSFNDYDLLESEIRSYLS